MTKEKKNPLSGVTFLNSPITIEFKSGSNIGVKGGSEGLMVGHVVGHLRFCQMLLAPGTNAIMKVENNKLRMRIGD